MRVTLNAEIDSIDALDEFCSRALEVIGFGSDRRLCFAAHEAIINTIQAYEQQASVNNRPITVEITGSFDRAQIMIIDRAGGIDPQTWEKKRAQKLEDMILAERGRGLLLIQSLVDELSYVLTPDGSSIVTLTKEGSGQNGI